MNIDPTSFTIGLAAGAVLIAALHVKVLRRMALSLKKLGIELGIEADDDKKESGVKIGDVGGDISGDIAGRDINKHSSFFNNVKAAVSAAKGPRETTLVSRENIKVEFPDTPEGHRAADRARQFPQQKEFFPSDDSQRILLPHVQRVERLGWKVTSIRWSDGGNNCFYVEFTLEKSFDRNA